jgi:3-oxoadipate enol-lactonase
MLRTVSLMEELMQATINGISIAYHDQGSGFPIVFLHAFPLSRMMWAPQEAALAQDFRIVTLDLRGHGESDAPLWHYTLEQAADDIRGLLDHLAIPHAVFVGLSMGGYILFAFYRRYAERVKGLVLADTRAQADTAEEKQARFELAQIAYKQGARAIADIMIPKLLSSATTQRRPELVQLVGELDLPTPPSDAKLMTERIPNARLTIIPGAAHLANLEQPELFNETVRSFVSTLASNRGG